MDKVRHRLTTGTNCLALRGFLNKGICAVARSRAELGPPSDPEGGGPFLVPNNPPPLSFHVHPVTFLKYNVEPLTLKEK